VTRATASGIRAQARIRGFGLALLVILVAGCPGRGAKEAHAATEKVRAPPPRLDGMRPVHEVPDYEATVRRWERTAPFSARGRSIVTALLRGAAKYPGCRTIHIGLDRPFYDDETLRNAQLLSDLVQRALDQGLEEHVLESSPSTGCPGFEIHVFEHRAAGEYATSEDDLERYPASMIEWRIAGLDHDGNTLGRISGVALPPARLRPLGSPAERGKGERERWSAWRDAVREEVTAMETFDMAKALLAYLGLPPPSKEVYLRFRAEHGRVLRGAEAGPLPELMLFEEKATAERGP
jgi:hypothetical protein